MQAAAVCFSGPLPLKGTKNMVPRRTSRPFRAVVFPRATAISGPDANTADYSSSVSYVFFLAFLSWLLVVMISNACDLYMEDINVFPAEACETIGGEACDAKMFAEVKLAAPDSSTGAKVSSEEVDREYLDYKESKTVFRSEACDDLGGEFCEPDFQKGV